MRDVFIVPALKKVKLLEEAVGATTSYQTISPFSLNPRDAIALQRAARGIAGAIGLGERTFIVGLAKQQERVAAHVHLPQYGEKEVFIEIDPTMADSTDLTLGMLAHELTHVYLHDHGISCGTTAMEDEILTDIGAVFLGMGKLMLNCAFLTDDRQVYDSQQKTFSTIKSRRLKSDYLSPDQLAFVYWFVCAMRQLPEAEVELYLTQGALQEVRRRQTAWGHYVRETAEFFKETEESTWQFAEELSVIERYFVFLQGGILRNLKAFLDESHGWLIRRQDLKGAAKSDDAYDPALRVINIALANTEIDKIADELDAGKKEIGRYVETLSSAVEHLRRLAPTPDEYLSQTCRKCQQRVKLLKGAGTEKVRCPKCGYVFIADSRPIDSLSPSSVQHRPSAKVDAADDGQLSKAEQLLAVNFYCNRFLYLLGVLALMAATWLVGFDMAR